MEIRKAKKRGIDMKGKEEWILGINKNCFNWGDTYQSKKEAIGVGRKELMSVNPQNPASSGKYSDVFMADMDRSFVCFYVGRLIRPAPEVNIDNIIEDLKNDAIDIYDEYCNDFLEDVTNKQREELKHNINKVVQSWLDKYNLRDYGYLVDDVERVKA